MAIKTIRFNKSNLTALVYDNKVGAVRDTEISGLKFKVGTKRAVFQFEKRVSGKKNAPAITISIGAFPAISVDEARQEARRLANLCERGIDPREERREETRRVVTLQEAVGKFFAVKKELSKKTLGKYHYITGILPQAWFEKDITAITADMIVDQFHVIRKGAAETCWEYLKVFHNIWNTCAPFFRDRKNERILKQSPIPEVRNMLKNVTRNRPKRSVIPANLLGKFVTTVEGIRCGENILEHEPSRAAHRATAHMCDIALLALFTAFRFNEARCLKWQYVDLDQGIIRLPGDARKDAGEFDGTKNHRDHWVPLSSYALDLMLKINHERTTISPYVFPAIHDPAKPVSRAHRVFTAISKLIGTHYSPHTSRRTFASAANEAGLGFLTCKRLLNHSYQGGVTGGYIVPGFNPDKERANFQKVCDYILDRRAEYLGKVRKGNGGLKYARAITELRRYALELGFDPQRLILESIQPNQLA